MLNISKSVLTVLSRRMDCAHSLRQPRHKKHRVKVLSSASIVLYIIDTVSVFTVHQQLSRLCLTSGIFSLIGICKMPSKKLFRPRDNASSHQSAFNIAGSILYLVKRSLFDKKNKSVRRWARSTLSTRDVSQIMQGQYGFTC